MSELQDEKNGVIKYLMFILVLVIIIFVLAKTDIISLFADKVDRFRQGIISIIFGISVIVYTKIVDHSKSIMAAEFRGYGSGILFIIIGLTLIFKSCGLDKLIHQ